LKVFTVAQVAQDWQVDKDTIYRLIHTGKLKAFKVGSDWRITQKALEDYINRGEREAYSPALPDTGKGKARKPGRRGGRNDTEYWKGKIDAIGKGKDNEGKDTEAWVKDVERSAREGKL